jgi:hypothetical protein
MGGGRHGVDVHHGDKAENQERWQEPKITVSPTWRVKCQSDFMTLPPVLLQELPAVVLLLERSLVSWSLVMDEHGENKNLRDSGHQSVIPYIHRRIELYCSSLALPAWA